MPRPFLAAAVLAAICALPLSARTHVWTGSESNLFSDPANWIGGSPADDPEAELVFPRAVRQSVINDLHGVTVKSITIEEDGYRIAGKPLALVEGAELDVRDADIVCALLFDGQAVAQPRRGQFRYSAAAVPAIHPALSLDAAASSVITIEHYGAHARVTPGAETAWHWDVFRAGFPAVHEIHNTLLGDTDNDGEVRWNLQSDKIRVKGIVAVIDQRAGTVHAVTGDGAPIAPSAEKINFLRDVSGHFAWANVPSGSRFLKTLWVRPGVGAWRGGPSTITTRYPGSDHALVKLADGIPVEGSPAPPAGVEPGDFFIATAVAETSATLFGGPVDERLAAAPSLPSEFWIPNYFHGREGGVATVTVYRLGSTERAATVHYRTGPADPGPVLYRPIEGTLAFAPHEFSRDVTIPLPADGVYGGTVHFAFMLDNPSGAKLRTSFAEVRVFDNKPGPGVTVRDVEVAEGDAGTREVKVELRLTAQSLVPLTVEWYRHDANPAFHGETRGRVTFAPLQLVQRVALSYTANTIAEPDRITEMAAYPSGYASRRARAGRIIVSDDDSVGINALDTKVSESAGSVTVTIALSAPRNTPTSVDYAAVTGVRAPGDATATGDAVAGRDFTPVTGTLTFAAGETRKQIVVPLLQDLTPEDDENFLLNLSNVSGRVTIRRAGRVVITDDADPFTLQFAPTVFTEGQRARVFIDARPVLEKTVPLWVYAYSGTATAGVDFSDATDFAIVWRYSDLVEFDTYADNLDEPSETFILKAVDYHDPAVVLATTTVVIEDSNPAFPIVTVGDVTVVEGTTASFPVTLSRRPLAPVSFRVRTIGDTATAGEDFTPFANIFTIPADQFSATITVPIAQDAKAEGTETFALELSQPWNTVLKTTVVRARIDDDDDPDTPLINVQDAASAERSGFVRFTVSLNRPAVTRTTVHYTTRDGSAKAGQDYSAAIGALTFEPGESAKTIDVAVAMDKEVEGNETFVFRLGNGLTATGTITDSNLTTRTRSVRH